MVDSYTAYSLEEALRLREDPALVPYTGGTDLMVWPKEDARYLFLHKVPEMKKIIEDDVYIRIGASCTFTEIIEHPLTPSILKEACGQIAAPAIRNAGSMGGNIGNGSPKADSALVLMAADAKLRLASSRAERVVSIREFYLGRQKLALNPDELIIEILLPKHGLENYTYQKIGARNALAISRVSFAGIFNCKDGIIKHCAMAFGAVSDVILCFEDIDKMLIGKTLEEAKGLKTNYLDAYDKAIIPLRGRVGIEYRKDVCMNLITSFLETNGV